MRRRLPAVLRHRDFGLLWTAVLLSGFSSQMIAVAIGWQVYEVRHNPLDLGLVGLAEFIPLPLLALPAGQLADRVSRRFLIALALVLSTVIAAVLVVVTVEDVDRLWPYLAVAFLSGIGSALWWPAARALAPTLVPPDLLATAIAYRSIAMQGATVAGPALGGLLFAVAPEIPYIVAGVLFLASLACILALHEGRAPADAEPFAGTRDDARGPALRPRHARHLRRDLARPLRRPLRRRGRAAAGLRELDPRRRPGRARDPAERPRGGRPHRGAAHRATPDRRPGRSQAPDRGRRLRPEHGRLRPLALVRALVPRPRGQRLRGHDLDEHPLDDRRPGDAERAPRPGERGRDGLHQRVERARRVRVRPGSIGARRHTRGRPRRHRDDRDRRELGALLPSARAGGPARGGPDRSPCPRRPKRAERRASPCRRRSRRA